MELSSTSDLWTVILSTTINDFNVFLLYFFNDFLPNNSIKINFNHLYPSNNEIK